MSFQLRGAALALPLLDEVDASATRGFLATGSATAEALISFESARTTTGGRSRAVCSIASGLRLGAIEDNRKDDVDVFRCGRLWWSRRK